jgi:glycine cleavage system regulatory protein
VFTGTVKHLAPKDREQITIEAMSTEAVRTSEIEGEILDRAATYRLPCTCKSASDGRGS